MKRVDRLFDIKKTLPFAKWPIWVVIFCVICLEVIIILIFNENRVKTVHDLRMGLESIHHLDLAVNNIVNLQKDIALDQLNKTDKAAKWENFLNIHFAIAGNQPEIQNSKYFETLGAIKNEVENFWESRRNGDLDTSTSLRKLQKIKIDISQLRNLYGQEVYDRRTRLSLNLNSILLIFIASLLTGIFVAWLLYQWHKKVLKENEVLEKQVNSNLQTTAAVAGGIMHSIKNELAILGSNPQSINDFPARVESRLNAFREVLLLSSSHSKNASRTVPINQHAVVLKCINLVESARSVKVQWRGEQNLKSAIDPDMLTFILSELLTNAINYTLDNTSIKISETRANNFNSIIIENTALSGIPIQSIGEPCVKFCSDSTGLGLFAVHTLLAKIDSKITFSNCDGLFKVEILIPNGRSLSQ